ncbi:DUF1800 domain-containing protein [Flavobacterium sp. SM2513]|uniref:DUF1800 domain-containing protein n=1 Tax=Flavobacterium sp. SM2513 TaxID=3424766 RepID=UPI003D7FC847
MHPNSLWSLRLGFSNKEAQKIETLGFKRFLEVAFNSKVDDSIPSFLNESPKTLEELKTIRQQLKTQSADEAKDLRLKENQVSQEMKIWWIEKMRSDEFPLREKMTCFWHNHYVSTFQKVKVNHWIFQHNQILRTHAFGNFKTLTKEVLKSNAMVRYLDNVDNRKGKINENLSRELLELFTLGIGNYTEEDIKNGAKGLAGLGLGETKAMYRKFQQDNDVITYFGQEGMFKADELIDIIFEQKAAPYLITRKLLKWFLYDVPSEELVTYYGDYLRKVDFEIQPLLQKIFTEEYAKNTAGSKIKDPLVYVLQLQNELQIDKINPRLLHAFLKMQGMDLFGQPNVKGWNGGKEWLSSQVYLQRNNVADLMCNGKGLGRNNQKEDNEMMQNKSGKQSAVALKFDASGTNKTIITELQNRLLFQADAEMQTDFETLLKYDFNPKSEGAENAVLRLFNEMVKRPEFQLI